TAAASKLPCGLYATCPAECGVGEVNGTNIRVCDVAVSSRVIAKREIEFVTAATFADVNSIFCKRNVRGSLHSICGEFRAGYSRVTMGKAAKTGKVKAKIKQAEKEAAARAKRTERLTRKELK